MAGRLDAGPPELTLHRGRGCWGTATTAKSSESSPRGVGNNTGAATTAATHEEPGTVLSAPGLGSPSQEGPSFTKTETKPKVT